MLADLQIPPKELEQEEAESSEQAKIAGTLW